MYTHEIFKRLLLWSFPLITDVHVPEKHTYVHILFVQQMFLYYVSHQTAPTHLSKSVKRLTLNVCCLSSLYPSPFFTASRA